MTRKIVQISAVSPGSTGDKGYHPAVLALADDGSVWGSGFNPATKNFDQWEKLPSLPTTDEEAKRLLDEQRSNREMLKMTIWHQLESASFCAD